MFRNNVKVMLIFLGGMILGGLFWHLPGRLVPGLALRATQTGWKVQYQNAFPEQASWERRGLKAFAEIYFPEDDHPVPDYQDPFRTRLTGNLHLIQDGEYTFITRVRGGIQLWINDILIVDAWHPVLPEDEVSRRSATVYLERGVHSIWIQTIHRNPTLPRFQVTWQQGDDPPELPLGAPWIHQR